MHVSDNILSYAMTHCGPFKKSELAEHLHSYGEINDTSLNTILSRLVSTNRLIKTGWGEYALPKESKYKWMILPQPETAELSRNLRKRYPLADFCVWDAGSIVPYMLHVPNVRMTIIDVERSMLRTFFDAIREMNPDAFVLLNPSKDEYYKYGSGRDCVVVNPLYSESPLENVEGMIVPTAEKVLVDIAVNPEFDYLQGSEVFTIYENVLTDCFISLPKLNRYARRRRKTTRIQTILDNIDLLNND